MNERFEFTKEELMMLCVLSRKYHYTKIAKIMKKNETAVYLKAKQLKIPIIEGDQRKKHFIKEMKKNIKELKAKYDKKIVRKKQGGDRYD